MVERLLPRKAQDSGFVSWFRWKCLISSFLNNAFKITQCLCFFSCMFVHYSRLSFMYIGNKLKLAISPPLPASQLDAAMPELVLQEVPTNFTLLN